MSLEPERLGRSTAFVEHQQRLDSELVWVGTGPTSQHGPHAQEGPMLASCSILNLFIIFK